MWLQRCEARESWRRWLTPAVLCTPWHSRPAQAGWWRPHRCEPLTPAAAPASRGRLWAHPPRSSLPLTPRFVCAKAAGFCMGSWAVLWLTSCLPTCLSSHAATHAAPRLPTAPHCSSAHHLQAGFGAGGLPLEPATVGDAVRGRGQFEVGKHGRLHDKPFVSDGKAVCRLHAQCVWRGSLPAAWRATCLGVLGPARVTPHGALHTHCTRPPIRRWAW